MPKSKLWTKYEEEHMRTLSDKYSWRRISTMLGRTPASVFGRARKIGCYRDGPRWMNSDRGVKLAILRGAGVSFADISKLMGVSLPSCQKAFNRNREEIVDIWRHILIVECAEKLRAMGLSEKTISKFALAMGDAFIPRMDLLSAALSLPELQAQLQSLGISLEDD